MQTTRKGFLKGLAGIAVAGGFFGRASEVLMQAQEKTHIPARSTRIRDVQIFPYSLEQKVVFRVSLATAPASDNIFVRLRTEDGVVGWGEASPYSPVTSETQQSDVAMGRALAALVRDKDVFAIPQIVSEMDALTPSNPSIKAAFEMALWDICGKIAGQPVCNLLGRYRDSFETDKTAFLDTPQAMADTVRGYLREGFRVVKVKVGESPEKDVERLRSIREAVGNDIILRVDANQGWSASEAVRCLRAIEQYRIQACEQPTPSWDWQGLKYVREHSPIPIMADETVHSPHDAAEAVRRDVCDLINIKLMKSGGILNAIRIAQIADAGGINCMVGCMTETSVALTAAAHVVASQKNIIYADLDSFLFNKSNPVIGGMELKQSVVHLPSTPGLGLDVDPAFLKTLTPA